MALSKIILVDGFLDGFTAAGLFGKLRRPGAPAEFIDSRSVEEFIQSGDIEATLHLYRASASKSADPTKGSAPTLVKPLSEHR